VFFYIEGVFFAELRLKISRTWLGATRPYVFSPISTTGASSQAPAQRRQFNENYPSADVSPTSSLRKFSEKSQLIFFQN